MAYYFPEGSKFYFSSTFAAALSVTAVTNANPAQATSAGHALVDQDEVLFTSGWEDATDSIYRVDQQTINTFDFLGLNATDTTWFPALAGVGTVKKVSAWTEIQQVLDISSSGGGARFTNIEPLAKRNAIAVPTGFDPTTITLTLGHDPALTNYLTLVNLSRTLTKVGIKMVIGGGLTTYGYGHIVVSTVPSLQRNQPNKVTAAFSLLGRTSDY